MQPGLRFLCSHRRASMAALIEVRPSFEIRPLPAVAVGRRPLPGGIAGAQFKQQDNHHGSAFWRGTRQLRDLTQGHQVKSTEGLFLDVIVKTAEELVVNFPDLYRTHVLGNLQRTLET